MSEFKIVPEKLRKELSMAISKGEFETVKKTIEDNHLDVDSYLDTEHYAPFIMRILISYSHKSESKMLEILRYMLEKGANPNTYCKSGYNSLHVAVQQKKLIRALDLFLDFGGDVNLSDNSGATIAYWAIQGFPWRTEGEERQLHLDVIKKVIMSGADLDYKNKFGVTPRKWLERTSEDVRQLVEQCEKLNPVYNPSNVVCPKFPTNYKYPEIVENLRKLIPVQGKAETIEAEMLRGLDNLKSEAYRNGNVNFSKQYKEHAEFIMNTLISSSYFNEKEIEKITTFSKKLMSARKPYLEDDVYDYLTDQICDFYIKKNRSTEKKKWWKFWEQ